VYPAGTVGQNIKSIQVIKPASQAASTVNSSGIDTAGYDEAIVILDCGTTAATGTLDVAVQDSADNSSFTAISPAVAFTQVTPANDDALYVGVLKVETPIRRYIRIQGITAAAASIYGVSVHLTKAVVNPSQTPQWVLPA